MSSDSILSSLTFYYISKKLLEQGGKIKEFVIRQKEIDKFIIDYSADCELSTLEVYNCQKAMDKYLEPNLKLVFNKVTQIERGKSGKLKHFISEIWILV